MLWFSVSGIVASTYQDDTDTLKKVSPAKPVPGGGRRLDNTAATATATSIPATLTWPRLGMKPILSATKVRDDGGGWLPELSNRNSWRKMALPDLLRSPSPA